MCKKVQVVDQHTTCSAAAGLNEAINKLNIQNNKNKQKNNCFFGSKNEWSCMFAINRLAAGWARLHMHTCSCISICEGICYCVYEKIIVPICWKNKAERAAGADLALAEACWFGLSNAFINHDESPLQFTSNQRLTAAQRWSPLAKWFSWHVVFRTAKELATWRSGCRWYCCASGTQLDQSYLKQRWELSDQKAH